MMGSTMNLISETHHLYEMREYTFIVFRKYTIIFPFSDASFSFLNSIDLTVTGC